MKFVYLEADAEELRANKRIADVVVDTISRIVDAYESAFEKCPESVLNIEEDEEE